MFRIEFCNNQDKAAKHCSHKVCVCFWHIKLGGHRDLNPISQVEKRNLIKGKQINPCDNVEKGMCCIKRKVLTPLTNIAQVKPKTL